MNLTEVMQLKNGSFVKHVPSNTLMLKGNDGLTNIHEGALRKWGTLSHVDYIKVDVTVKENWALQSGNQ